MFEKLQTGEKIHDASVNCMQIRLAVLLGSYLSGFSLDSWLQLKDFR